jgi:hypothetical protein
MQFLPSETEILVKTTDMSQLGIYQNEWTKLSNQFTKEREALREALSRGESGPERSSPIKGYTPSVDSRSERTILSFLEENRASIPNKPNSPSTIQSASSSRDPDFRGSVTSPAPVNSPDFTSTPSPLPMFSPPRQPVAQQPTPSPMMIQRPVPKKIIK